MTRTATPNIIAGLAARLTDSQDRETYAALVSYVNELPPGDEFRQLMEMLGLLSLVGQRVPDAVAQLLMELRSQTKTVAEYHSQVDARLANLPKEIAAGVDPAAIAKNMSESFRQQLSATALHDTASLLKAAVITLKSLSAELISALQPISATLADQTAKLVATAQAVDLQAGRVDYPQKRSGRWQGVLAVSLFVLGALYGGFIERRQTNDSLRTIVDQIDQIRSIIGLRNP